MPEKKERKTLERLIWKDLTLGESLREGYCGGFMGNG